MKEWDSMASGGYTLPGFVVIGCPGDGRLASKGISTRYQQQVY
jgi:hypothetical protein|tara:strand:+ start:907 stop:1035 length:129 start_codon:yes stop_codon:yes gene_type:complete